MGLDREVRDVLLGLPETEKEQVVELLSGQLDRPRRSLDQVLRSIDSRRLSLNGGFVDGAQLVREGREER